MKAIFQIHTARAGCANKLLDGAPWNFPGSLRSTVFNFDALFYLLWDACLEMLSTLRGNPCGVFLVLFLQRAPQYTRGLLSLLLRES